MNHPYENCTSFDFGDKTPCILMRTSLAEEEEQHIASKYLPVYELRSQVPSNSLVIGRYSILPYARELEEDLRSNGSVLINTYAQHMYVADLKNWYYDLEEITPKTWFSLAEFKKEKPTGSFVLKGSTNSKKGNWKTHMFASSHEEVDEVYRRLSQDGLMLDQDIYIRQYIPLQSFGEGINGLPISEEYRFFVLDKEVMASGFYWSQFPEVQEENKLDSNVVPQDFLTQVIESVCDSIRFYVVDIAKTVQGDWIVVELNDGCMSGPSCVPSDELYNKIKLRLSKSQYEQLQLKTRIESLPSK